MRRVALAALLAIAVALAGSAASAHLVFERSTLRGAVRGAAAIALAEIASPPRVWAAPDGSDHQEYVTARILETLDGPPLPAQLDFFAHAEGLPRWRTGERAILFLQRTVEHPESAGLAARFPWLTLQGSGAEWTLATAEDEVAIVAAVRGWIALRGTASPAAVRSLLLRQLEGGDARLRDDALVELVRARREPGVLATSEDAAPFTALVLGSASDPGAPPESPPGISVQQRITLARVLDRAFGFSADAALLELTKEPLDARDRRSLLRGAGQSRSPALSAWLAEQLRSPDVAVRRDAAASLAHPWHEGQVDALAAAARDPDPGVARAAARALGGVGDARAVGALEALAAAPGLAAAPVARVELARLAPRRRP